MLGSDIGEKIASVPNSDLPTGKPVHLHENVAEFRIKKITAPAIRLHGLFPGGSVDKEHEFGPRFSIASPAN